MLAAVSHGRGPDWQVALTDALANHETVEGANVGFVYVSDIFAAHAESIRAAVRSHTGVRLLTGSVGIGICSTGLELMDKPGLVLMTLRLPDQAVQEARGELVLGRGAPRTVGIVHAHPSFASRLDEAPAFGACFLVGALTSSRGPNIQLHSTGIAEDGATGLVIDASQVTIHTGVSQGCRPLGRPHRVSRCHGQVIGELDGRPALDVLTEEAADLIGGDLRRLARVFAAFGLPNRDTDDWLVRHLLGVDPGSRAIAVAYPVRQGDRLQFVRRDAQAAREDMASMLDKLKERAPGHPVAGLYFSCVGRGKNLFGEPSVELQMVREVLGDFPLVGFFGNGEVCNRSVYGYTGVLALIHGQVTH